jgi:hypothetical protein
MKTVLIVLIVLLVLVAVVGALLVGFTARLGREKYQQYKGMERQRESNKELRMSGYERLSDAGRQLIEAERALTNRGELAAARDIERLRVRVSTVADRMRYATHGYAPLSATRPVREDGLAALQEHDADALRDADELAEHSREIRGASSAAEPVDLTPLVAMLERLESGLDRRRTVT